MAKAWKASRQTATDDGKVSTEKSAGQGKPTGKPASESSGSGTEVTLQQDAESLLRADHRKVERLFQEFEQAKDSGRKQELAQEICKELVVHSQLEEDIFYPACREKGVEDDALGEAQVEHDIVKFLVADIQSSGPGSAFHDAKLAVLSDLVKHHVDEEEKPLLGIFAKARTAGVDMAAVGSRLKERKERLTAEAGERIEAPPLRSLRARPATFNRYREEKDMERWDERDERGGYLRSDDDERRFSRGRYESSGADDENGRYPRRGGYAGRDARDDRGWGGRERGGYGADYGRAGHSGYGGSEDDSRYGGAGGGGSGGYRGARSGGYGGPAGRFDDDDYRRPGRRGSEIGDGGYVTGYGGGFGSGYGGGMGGTQDYPRTSRRGGYGVGEYGEPRGRGYGGESGYSRGSDRDYGSSGYRDDDDFGVRGDDRGRGRGSFSRQRDEQGRFMSEDDYGGRSGGRGHDRGGWFGDPRGHAEASRRGWRDGD